MAAALVVSLVPSAAWAQESGTPAPAQAGAGGAASPGRPRSLAGSGRAGGRPGLAGVRGRELQRLRDPAPSPAPSPSGDATASPSSTVAPGPSSEGDTSSQAPAQGRQGAPATPSAAPRDAVQLSGVELAKPSSFELGTKLEAKAYTGPSSYAPTYVDRGRHVHVEVRGDDQPVLRTRNGREIEGETGSTFTVDDDDIPGRLHHGVRHRWRAARSTSAPATRTATGRSSPRERSTSTPPRCLERLDDQHVRVRRRRHGDGAGQGEGRNGPHRSRTSSPTSGTASTDNAAFSAIPGATEASLVLDEGYAGHATSDAVLDRQGGRTARTPTRATEQDRGCRLRQRDLGHARQERQGVAGRRAQRPRRRRGLAATSPHRTTRRRGRGTAATAHTPPTTLDRRSHRQARFEVTDDLVGRYLEARADGGLRGERILPPQAPWSRRVRWSCTRWRSSGSARVGCHADGQGLRRVLMRSRVRPATSSTTSGSTPKPTPPATALSRTSR